MAFTVVSFEITAFILLLRVSLLTAGELRKHSGNSVRPYDADRLRQEIKNLESGLKFYDGMIDKIENSTTVMQEEMKTLQDQLEAQATRRNTTVAEFVKCLVNTSEEHYRPEIYRSISKAIREVNQSYTGFFVMPADKPLWNESLTRGSGFGASQIYRLIQLITNLTTSKSALIVGHETKSIFENALTNMKREYTLLISEMVTTESV
nr:unnamed protein product [Trichobilharzia regenti]